MSTKYNFGERSHESRIIETGRGDVALTDHSLHRWNERTPHQCPVSVQQAFRRGEWIRHPTVAGSPNDPRDPKLARVYRHLSSDGTEWGVVWLIDEDEVDPEQRVRDCCAGLVAVTCFGFETIEHGPSRGYLHSHGPHGGDL